MAFNMILLLTNCLKRCRETICFPHIPYAGQAFEPWSMRRTLSRRVASARCPSTTLAESCVYCGSSSRRGQGYCTALHTISWKTRKDSFGSSGNKKKSNIIIPCHQTWAPQHFNLNNMRACSISSLHLRCIVPMRSDCQPMCISFPSLNHPARKQFKIDL